NFWNAYRKECRLINYQALVSKGDEKRLKLTAEIVLSNQNNKFMPECIVEPFGLMEEEDSPLALTKIEAICESFTIDIFATESSDKATKTVTGCTIQSMRLVGEGEKDKREVTLQFVVYMPADKPLNDWAFTHLHKMFYVEAVNAQGDLFDRKPAVEVAPSDDKAKKNGPKELV